jgi:hypothetical protein
MDNKINTIKSILDKYSITNINIPDFLVENIYNLFVNNIKCDVDLLNNDILYLYFGIYYRYIERNDELMKKYYLKAIEYGNDYAMNNLAHYYDRLDISDDLAIKYYIMAISKGNNVAMRNLESCYHDKIKYEIINKYYSLIDTNLEGHNYFVNMLLCKKFNIDFALRVYGFLGQQNIDKLKKNIYFVLL